jgi:hypothetical protein
MIKTTFDHLREMFPPGTPLEFLVDDIGVEGVQHLLSARYSDGTIIVYALWNADRRKMWAWFDGQRWQVSEERPSIVGCIKPRQR